MELNIELATTSRRRQRFDLSCRVRIRIERRHYAGRLENISQSGARFRTFTQMRDRGKTTLLIPDLGPLEGRLRWIQDDVAGVLFDRVIEDDRLQRWLGSRLVCLPDTGHLKDRYGFRPQELDQLAAARAVMEETNAAAPNGLRSTDRSTAAYAL